MKPLLPLALVAGLVQGGDPLECAGTYHLETHVRPNRFSTLELNGDGVYSLSWLPDVDSWAESERGTWELTGQSLSFHPDSSRTGSPPRLASVLAIYGEDLIEIVDGRESVRLVRETPRRKIRRRLGWLEASDGCAFGGPFHGGPISLLRFLEEGTYTAIVCPPGAECLNSEGAGHCRGRWSKSDRGIEFTPTEERPIPGGDTLVASFSGAFALLEGEELRLKTGSGEWSLFSSAARTRRELGRDLEALDLLESRPDRLAGRFTLGSKERHLKVGLVLEETGRFHVHCRWGHLTEDSELFTGAPQGEGDWTLRDGVVRFSVRRESARFGFLLERARGRPTPRGLELETLQGRVWTERLTDENSTSR